MKFRAAPDLCPLAIVASRCQVIAGEIGSRSYQALLADIRLVVDSVPVECDRPKSMLISRVVGDTVHRIAFAAGIERCSEFGTAFVAAATAGFQGREWVQRLSHLILRSDELLAVDSDSSECQPSNRYVASVLRSIRSRYSEVGLKLGDVARDASCSEFHLARLLKSKTGGGYSSHLRKTRVHAARRLLSETRLSVKEIAASTGHMNSTQLCRNFQREFGITPGSLRKSVPHAPLLPH